MSAAEKHVPTYTVADYQRWKGDWELWDGVAISLSPSAFGRHQTCAKNLCFLIESALRLQGCHAALLYEIDWVVREDTVVRPDVVVLCGEAPERHVEAVPAIVVEVLSEATRQNDLSFKRTLYREQRVSYYVIVDPENETLIVDQLQTNGEYESVTVDGMMELTICDHCTLQLRPADIFRR